MTPPRARLAATVAGLLLVAPAVPWAASAAVATTVGSRVSSGPAAGEDAGSAAEEAEEYLGLARNKIRAYEAYLARESARGDRAQAGVLVVRVPADASRIDDSSGGQPAGALVMAAAAGLLAGAIIAGAFMRLRRMSTAAV